MENLKSHDIGVVSNDEDTPLAQRGFASRIMFSLVDNNMSAYRSVPQHVDYTKCQKWLKNCLQEHESCNTAEPGDRNSPIKLIDVVARRVVKFSRKNDIKYATLSYVCGPSYSVFILQSSPDWTYDATGNRRHPLPAGIPATIEDAMTVTQNLDLNYLWVDSICIAQDDEDEKRAQIDLMFNIYSDATLCIVSAAGKDSHTPLPGVSVPRALQPMRKVKIKDGMDVGVPFPALGSVLSTCRYMGRAWTYQELLLSKRILFFTTAEVFYYCALSTHHESRLEQPGGHPEAQTWASLAPESNSHLIGNAVAMRKTTDPADLCRLFAAAAQEYSSRRLTYQEDTIRAFRGVLSMFCQLLNGPATSACPDCMVLNSLTWRDPRTNTSSSHLAKRRMCSDSPQTAVLPSWVWCSFDGPVKMTSIPYCYSQSVCNIFAFANKTNELAMLFPKIAAGECCTCSHPEHKIKVRNPMPLPVKTKAITFPILAEGDDELIPGQADLSTSEGVTLGPCDFRGQCSLDQLHGSTVTLMQLFSEVETKPAPHVTALVLRTCRLQESVDTVLGSPELQGNITSLLSPVRKIPQIATEPPIPDVAAHKTFGRSLVSFGCPESLQIQAGTVPALENVLVGTRIGMAYVGCKQWIRLQPKDSVVFLI
ncbi:uncharacterized protein A1O5_08381 [Cladophialophora psammophila CBS 110553]|uniref:Heterokaryon incompatibility domain-containing protein n=1 Tax=Cladophialophora psammophila CBS 110553 TaxID=1182543 RepID=W9WK96_9EURO|nr:uncharacterized protein A1O5_08381 [Cladophialophora psammophila CBS 110553]EXJ68587.1 hypothetical protein A1O5_08381 [Cladophialophora psammophila CBS 110553]